MLLVVLAIAFNAGAQTKEIYTHPQFDSIAQKHTQLAILPFDVLINLRPKEK